MSIRNRALNIALFVALESAGAACMAHGAAVSSKRMPDGKQWTTENLSVAVDGSRCYDDAEPTCRRFGRLYTWEAAQQVCRSLGAGWRLPSDGDWRQLAKRYGGLREDSDDSGAGAYAALVDGGPSGFDARLGGGFVPAEGHSARLNEHGFYWSASESGPSTAVFYNFGRNGHSLNRQRDGSKQMAVSVRCISD